jgi:gliding motility-associated-like protein
MKKLTPYALAFFTVLCLAFPKQAKASHGAGGELIYEWITDSTYRWFFKFYRDCSGSTEPAQQTLCAWNPCTNQTYNWPMFKYGGLIPPGVQNGTPVSAGCSGPQFGTKCDVPQGNLPGYREWWYVTDPQKLIGQCDSWRFSTFVGVRNPSLNLASQPNFYVETYFNNLAAQGNSSPYFSIKPIPYCCINQPYAYNNGAIDPNGDSLTSEIINPLTGSGCNVAPTNIGLSNLTPAITFPSNPMQTNNTFSIGINGQMNFIPTQAGAWTLTVRTKEWRNGIVIGSVMRDVQVQVLTGCSQVPTTISVPVNVIGAVTLPNGNISGCVDQQLKFSYNMTSTDPLAILIAEDNHTQAITGSNTSYVNQKTNSVTGTFDWTPSMTQAGNYSFSVTLRDSTCHPPGIVYTHTVTFNLQINPATEAFKDTAVCPGDPVQLSVINGGNFQWNIVSGPTGSLSTTTGASTVASPYATTKYEVVSQQTAQCKHNKDTVTVTTLPPPAFVSPADIITCPGIPNVIDMGITPAPGVTYTMQWSPTKYLSSSTSTAPTVIPLDDVTYYIVIQSSDNKCRGFDTVNVDVLDGFKIENNDTAICDGESIQVNVTGDTRYTYQWSTNDQSGGTSISDINISNPIIKAGPVGKWTYKLTAHYIGCPKDSSTEFDIEVQPIPEVTAPEDANICFGDTIHLTGKVTPAFNYKYKWTPGQSLNDPEKINPVYTSRETTTLTFSATTSAGCTDKDEVTLTGIPSKFIEVRDTMMCPGDTAQLHMTGTALASFGWMQPRDNSLGNIKSADPYVYPDGTSSYTVYALDTNGCRDTQTAKVVVNPRAIVNLPKSVTIYPGESYQMRPGGNAVAFNWFPYVGLNDHEISNPIAQPKVNTRYIVTAQTESGCKVVDSIEVLVAPDSYIDVPNAFIPGHNSLLKPVRLGDATLKSFVIFNRWGNKVFESSNINDGWDGNYKGEAQPMGAYVYTIEAVTPAGRRFTKQGNVTLIR